MNKKNIIYLIMFVLFILSFTFRVMYMNDGLYHHDSVQLAYAVENSLETGTIHGAVGGKYFAVFVYMMFHVVSYLPLELSLTLFTILMASLSIIALFLFVNELTDNLYIAAVSALLFSFNPLYLSITTYAKSHGLAIFMILMTAYFLVRFLKDNNLISLILFIVLYGLSLMTRIDNILFVPMFIFLIVFSNKFVKDSKVDGFDQAVLFCTIITMTIFLYGMKLIYYYSVDIPRMGIEMILIHWFVSYDFIIVSLTTPIFVLMVLSGFYMIYKKQDHLLLLLMIWFCSIFFVLGMSPTVAPRYLITCLIPLIIIVSHGMNYLRSKNNIIAALFITGLIIFQCITIIPILEYRNDYCGTKGVRSLCES